MSRTTLHLAKQNFKFSAAHFLIFDERSAERLHGHNYRVRVDLEISPSVDMGVSGFSVDFQVFKEAIKARLDQWDEIILLPGRHPDMMLTEEGTSLQVRFRDRYYVFPANEVVILPVTNTSVESLSRLLAEEWAEQFRRFGVCGVSVFVEETDGQGASFSISL